MLGNAGRQKCYRPTGPHVELPKSPQKSPARWVALVGNLQTWLCRCCVACSLSAAMQWPFLQVTVVNNSVHLLKVGNTCIDSMLLPFGCAYLYYIIIYYIIYVHEYVQYTWIFQMCRICAFSQKNMPKGRHSTYLEDPGICINCNII